MTFSQWRSKLVIAVDCIRRAADAVDSEQYVDCRDAYPMDQLAKAIDCLCRANAAYNVQRSFSTGLFAAEQVDRRRL